MIKFLFRIFFFPLGWPSWPSSRRHPPHSRDRFEFLNCSPNKLIILEISKISNSGRSQGHATYAPRAGDEEVQEQVFFSSHLWDKVDITTFFSL